MLQRDLTNKEAVSAYLVYGGLIGSYIETMMKNDPKMTPDQGMERMLLGLATLIGQYTAPLPKNDAFRVRDRCLQNFKRMVKKSYNYFSTNPEVGNPELLNERREQDNEQSKQRNDDGGVPDGNSADAGEGSVGGDGVQQGAGGGPGVGDLGKEVSKE